MKKGIHYVVVVILTIPVLYLTTIYHQLPHKVPTHFGIDGTPDSWGDKIFIWLIAAILTIVSGVVYLLMCHVHRLDPKKKAAENKDSMQKIGLAVVVFIAAVTIFIIRSTVKGVAAAEPGFIFAGVGLLLTVIGNYMTNLKPNYFAGLRLPWTLENEDNWRKTHLYAGKLWFYGGILIAVISLVIPFPASLFIFFAVILAITIIPAVYSYRIYRAEKKS